jgi:hypothetical protein
MRTDEPPGFANQAAGRQQNWLICWGNPAKAGATGVKPAASGVTGAITRGLYTHESPLFKPNLDFCGEVGPPLKQPQFAGIRNPFGHKFRLVPNRSKSADIYDFGRLLAILGDF